MTFQASSVIYCEEDVNLVVPSSTPPPIPPPLVQIRSIKGIEECDEDDGGSYPYPPPPHIDFLMGGGQTTALLSSLFPLP